MSCIVVQQSHFSRTYVWTSAYRLAGSTATYRDVTFQCGKKKGCREKQISFNAPTIGCSATCRKGVERNLMCNANKSVYLVRVSDPQWFWIALLEASYIVSTYHFSLSCCREIGSFSTQVTSFAAFLYAYRMFKRYARYPTQRQHAQSDHLFRREASKKNRAPEI